LAITKARKDELVAEYAELIERSQALILTEYRGLTMPNLNQLRDKIRQSGGEYHITKNTLLQIALERAGFPAAADLFDGPTAVGFSFEDPAATAKALLDLRRDLEMLVVKGGLMKDGVLSADQVQALAELPPREVVLAQVLGTIQGPLASLVGLLNAPLRDLVYVLQQRGAQAEEAPAAAS
jgi:large subunit ribosomal protein L10